jgi:putative SOS response-associated peptidase YedK
MPVILQEADFGNWLDANVTEPSKVAAMVEKAQSDFCTSSGHDAIEQREDG